MRHCTKYVQIRLKYYCVIPIRVRVLFVFEFGVRVISLRGNAVMYRIYINHKHTLTLAPLAIAPFSVSFSHSAAHPLSCFSFVCVRACFFAFLMGPIRSSRPPIHLKFPSTKCYQFIHFFHLNLFIHSNFE